MGLSEVLGVNIAKSNALDKAIEAAYYRNCAGTQINIMDIPRLYAYVREFVTGGGDLEQGVKDAISLFAAVPGS